ncbi:MAG: hypothetical protein HY904_24075 [Deltaproteobacteria bacterium]|nr:hypothetical protein [Deltaproteobacteria bacterium]
MAEMLPKTASGKAHERFGVNTVATMRAHEQHNPRLTEPQRTALAAERERLGVPLRKLSEANVPYGAWLDSALLEVRAEQRVGDFLCDESQRDAVALARRYPKAVASLPGGQAALWTEKQPARTLRLGREATVDSTQHTARQLRLLDPQAVPGAPEVAGTMDKSAGVLLGFNEKADRIAAGPVPLKFAVDKAIVEFRGELELMKARLTLAGLSGPFIDSLFPELSKGGSDTEDSEEPGETPVGPQ